MQIPSPSQVHTTVQIIPKVDPAPLGITILPESTENFDNKVNTPSDIIPPIHPFILVFANNKFLIAKYDKKTSDIYKYIMKKTGDQFSRFLEMEQ